VLAERVRAAAEISKCRSGSWRGRVTFSVGVAELAPPPDASDNLIARADGAMYEAKRQGRNHVCAA
jgi:diguanylate cyclase (GGDEF)-like protein